MLVVCDMRRPCKYNGLICVDSDDEGVCSEGQKQSCVVYRVYQNLTQGLPPKPE
jgi:hypothetical protein